MGKLQSGFPGPFSLDRATGLQLGEELRRAGIPLCSFPSAGQGQSNVYLCMLCLETPEGGVPKSGNLNINSKSLPYILYTLHVC